ncbi:hypothetical protein COT62_03130 [Candidatus Roizmanbacteria bacterium CG09_land_8_20_14_0_10_41_9]|uniref:Glycosyl transferase n=1 Tax=Candidatus Roizmanbacteria bacterium CG09_land_8_20_14_0_10_41_9 TaxID=1974850 RepID=A0A2H0WSA1_9BACT|nr:MAG: hypothetical protein COT62_03130 [Candidatus Roizmanbacteria bacterium CG09_land_8_20_14_0_10_41_9]
MNIALVAPIEETVPPTKYGGTEWVAYHIAHQMGKKGHKVDVYAAGDSKQDNTYTLIPTVPQSIRTIPEYFKDLKLRESQKFITLTHITKLLMKKKYDIVHNHYGWRFLIFSDFIPSKIITTHHGPLSFPYQNAVYLDHKDQAHVSISNNQRIDLPDLNYVATIYNGIDLHLFPFVDGKITRSSPIAFLARMNHEKGALEAATVAQTTKHPIRVAAKVDKIDEPYFEQFRPFIDNKLVFFEGEIDPVKRLNLLQNARCLLAPIKWEEPFGLMFIEAMSCGAPIITFARGSVPEIIKDGETGFIVNQSSELKRGEWITKKMGVDGLCEAVERIYSMPQDQYETMRRACRACIEKKFTVEKMGEEYEKVYSRLLSSS